jgi:hypothetical protein
MVNKHAQALGRLSGAKKTINELREMARKRWAKATPEDRERHAKRASERMRAYWIGWRKAKELKEKATRKSVKRGFDLGGVDNF